MSASRNSAPAAAQPLDDGEAGRPLLDPALCYRALSSRDARFDGRFFIGVVTTGVYCRPVCPARTPKRQNVRFFPCAAAAGEAGFRPCLRCRPESSPGTPAWLGTSATVSRALRHIAAGGLDDGSVGDLADRLGVGERHLRRLFMEHLGASPIAVAQTRRIHFAKKLIDETDLPMTRIALDAGFASVRRFNSAIKNAYDRNPSALRRRSARTSSRPERLALKLPFREPFDWPLLLEFLALRAIPGVENVSDGVYRRTVRLGERTGVIEVSRPGEAPYLLLEVPVTFSPELVMIVERVRRLFDLGADPDDIDGQLAADPRLGGRIARRPGIRVPGAWDGFEMAVRGIIGQQVTVRGATTIVGRVVARHGEPLGEDGETAGDNGHGVPALTHVFPDAHRLADADLAGIGMPGGRARTIGRLAAEVAGNRISLAEPVGLDRSVDALTSLPGIGPWTAQYIAMRALAEPDAFPVGDVGVQRALGNADRHATAKETTKRAEAWRPWRAYAVMYLWTIDAAAAPV